MGQLRDAGDEITTCLVESWGCLQPVHICSTEAEPRKELSEETGDTNDQERHGSKTWGTTKEKYSKGCDMIPVVKDWSSG